MSERNSFEIYDESDEHNPVYYTAKGIFHFDCGQAWMSLDDPRNDTTAFSVSLGLDSEGNLVVEIDCDEYKVNLHRSKYCFVKEGEKLVVRVVDK